MGVHGPTLVINLAHKVDVHIFFPIALCYFEQLPMVEAFAVEMYSSIGPTLRAAYRLSLEEKDNYIHYQEQRGTAIFPSLGSSSTNLTQNPTSALVRNVVYTR